MGYEIYAMMGLNMPKPIIFGIAVLEILLIGFFMVWVTKKSEAEVRAAKARVKAREEERLRASRPRDMRVVTSASQLMSDENRAASPFTSPMDYEAQARPLTDSDITPAAFPGTATNSDEVSQIGSVFDMAQDSPAYQGTPTDDSPNYGETAPPVMQVQDIPVAYRPANENEPEPSPSGSGVGTVFDIISDGNNN